MCILILLLFSVRTGVGHMQTGPAPVDIDRSDTAGWVQQVDSRTGLTGYLLLEAGL